MIGPVYARKLHRLNIKTAEDLLTHFPFRYQNFSLLSKIASVQEGEVVTISGKIEMIKNEYTRNRRRLQKAKIIDETGSLDVIWFNQPFLIRTLHAGDEVNLSGKIHRSGNKLVMESPDYELKRSDPIHTGRLVPIYPETAGLSSKWLRSRIYPLLKNLGDAFEEFLPTDILEKNELIDEKEAIKQIHFPDNEERAQLARKRLAFDELFLLQLKGLKLKREWAEETVGHRLSISKYKKEIEDFWNRIPFDLTDAQRRVIGEIFHDLSSEKPMNRLLEGDVGSGKTVVAAIAMYLAHLNGYQATLMAPTEILALQHYQTISNILKPLGVKIALLTGNKRLKEEDLESNIFIGTHALLSQKLKVQNLGLVVIDEQHRFGVEQRAALKQKGINPHLLTLTATPIPRTIALTLYGELDLSYLNQMPPGRKPVKTWVVPDGKRAAAYNWIKNQIQENGSQSFIICPFIEESETLSSVKAATVEYENLKKTVFPNLKMALLHGKIKPKERSEILEGFRMKKFDILVATPVVEVGIDIPGATIMLIEGADRFGLAQLHQFRGRVGRNDIQSYCLLFLTPPGVKENPISPSNRSLGRLKAMESHYFGAELAEIDLKLRGAGDIYGIKQHGLSSLKIASFSDFELISKTRKIAEEFLENHRSDLEKSPLLQAKLKKFKIENVSPD